MAVALVGLAALAVLATLVLCHSHVAALVATVRADREQIAAERRRHMEAMVELVADQAAERREWASERAVLLNRIQDPQAGVAASMVLLPPGGADSDPRPDLGVEFIR